MKKSIFSLSICAAIFSVFAFANSCNKFENSRLLSLSEDSKLNIENKIKPNTTECPPGYHWDFEYMECVPDNPGCAEGFHWDPDAGGCVADSSTPPTLGLTVITNPNNSYDYVGNYHNDAVANILPNLDPSNPVVDSIMLVLIKNYAINHWGFDADSIQAVYDYLSQKWNFPTSPLPELDTIGNAYYSAGDISINANNYIHQIDSIANQWLNASNPNILLYSSFAQQLIYLEEQVNNDNSLSNDEKVALLSICSVGRYSAAFWGNYINNPLLQNSTSTLIVKPMLMQIPLWLGITLADVAGALSGYVKFGTLGAIVGGIAGSISYILKVEKPKT